MKLVYTRSALAALSLTVGCPDPVAVCGNNVTEAPEQCDDGNIISDDGCSSACTLEAVPLCGDGATEDPEQCDDGNTNNGDGCSSDCQLESTCGNGLIEAPELCDDGNQTNGDGCDNNCLPTGAGICAGITPVSGTDVTLDPLPFSFNQPIYLTTPVGDIARLFVVEKGGTIRVVKNNQLLPTPFLNISTDVSAGSEQGLLSMAFHPNFAVNGRYFVSYTDLGGDSVVSEFTVSADPDVSNTTEKIILTLTQPFGNHNGGLIKFGPDGMLYIGFGDGGSANDPDRTSQDPLDLLGKMLRLDIDTGDPFAIPADNPFIGFASVRNEIWALGLRNPWRFSFDRQTGDLYIGDVGQGAFEEVDFEPANSPGGLNWGWSDMEGDGHCVNNNNCNDPNLGFTNPITEYTHGGGRCSITGGYVYRGCTLPDLSGTYFYNDVCSGQVFSLEVVGGLSTNEQEVSNQIVLNGSGVSWGEDARGELYVMELQGTVSKVVPAP